MSKLKPAIADPSLKSLGENGEFTFGISIKRLSDIVENKTRVIELAAPDETFQNLSEPNQKALVHLVKAAQILNQVFLKQDHPDNIRAREAFQKAAARGDERAQLSSQLFDAFNGLIGSDMYAKKTRKLKIFKDKKMPVGGGFYPQDITKKELVAYILTHPEQASAIFSNNTMVVRSGERLEAIPYSVIFREEMENAAFELMQAASETDHEGFAAYLKWQAQALVNDSDPEMVFNAEKAWINLEDSQLEFTIARESYEDQFSSDVAAEPRVKALFEKYGIKPKNKDILGVRVGITNIESYQAIAGYRKQIDAVAAIMPYNDLYYQSKPGEGGKMSFADVDLVTMTGDYAALRGGFTVAQNFPNDDKLSVQLGAGSRLVFHRQYRVGGDPAQLKAYLNALVAPQQRDWYDENARFLFTVGHELAHSLGPATTIDGRNTSSALGKWGAILEENKADVASIFMTDYFVKIGKFTQEEANKIYLTWIFTTLPNKQPSEQEAHRFRAVMQINYFRERGAIILDKGGKLSINPDLMAAAAQDMLKDVILIQLEGDADEAEAFVKRFGEWNDVLQYICDEQMKLSPRLYMRLEQPLADQLLKTAPTLN